MTRAQSHLGGQSGQLLAQQNQAGYIYRLQFNRTLDKSVSRWETTPLIRHSPEFRARQQVPSGGSLLPTHGPELTGPFSGRCYPVGSDLLMNASQFSLGFPLS